MPQSCVAITLNQIGMLSRSCSGSGQEIAVLGPCVECGPDARQALTELSASAVVSEAAHLDLLAQSRRSFLDTEETISVAKVQLSEEVGWGEVAFVLMCATRNLNIKLSQLIVRPKFHRNTTQTPSVPFPPPPHNVYISAFN